MCSDSFVTAAMKSRIAAHAAAFRKATQSPFGSDDEIGMLNLVDGESRRAIMDRADPSRVYDLSVDNFVGMPGWFGAEDQPYQIWMTHTPRGELADDVMRVGNRTAANRRERGGGQVRTTSDRFEWHDPPRRCRHDRLEGNDAIITLEVGLQCCGRNP